MVRFTAAFLILLSAADVTPRGSSPAIGSSAIIAKTFNVDFHGVAKTRDGDFRVFLRITRKGTDPTFLFMDQSIAVGGSLGVTEETDIERSRGISPGLRGLLKKEPPIAFDPKTKLLSMKQHPEWPVRMCILTMTPDGWGCVEVEWRKVKAVVNEIVLQEEGGKKVTLRNSFPSGRMPADELCTVHGGSIRARLLSGEEKDEARAHYLLSGADEDWKSRNPAVRRRAQGAYAKLLKVFASTSVVENNKDRIKTRSEAEIDD